MKHVVMALVSGFVFAVGLVVSGMTSPAKVVGFLDPLGAWDPSLALVMAGAIGVHAIIYRLIVRRGSALGGARLQVPTRKDIDARLIGGAALFGVGWGLGGVCPGPGLVGVVSAAVPFLTFVGAMLAGMALFTVWEAVRERARTSTPT